MLLRQMQYFAAVVETNSFTEAAERCYISQSAMSQQIRSLEHELGVKLLERGNRSFTLTVAGEYFYTHCKDVLAAADMLVRGTRRVAAEDERLRIGYLRSYGGLELHHAVAEFSALYPEVTLSIVAGTHEELYDLLRTGDVDVILSDQRRAFSDAYVNFELVLAPCLAELSVNNALSSRERVTLEDLHATPCILISPPARRESEREFYMNTLGFGGSFVFAENLEDGRLLVAGNRGFLPVDNAGTLPPAGAGSARVPIYRCGSPLTRNYCAFWPKERGGYYVEEFAALLRRLLAA